MDNTGIGDVGPTVDIHVLCECGKTLEIDLDGWVINVEGTLNFKCPCGKTWKPESTTSP